MRAPVIEQLWESIADAGRELLRSRRGAKRRAAPDLARDLLSTRGEASGIAIAREVVERVEAMSDADRLAFLLQLAWDWDVDRGKLGDAIAGWSAEPEPRQLEALRRAVEPRRVALFERMIMAPGGTRALVRLREKLLDILREHPELGPVDGDLRDLMTRWFNPGLLELRRLDWDSPASLLEKLIRYEKVHKMQGLEELRRRVVADRRFFAFFHPALVDEPLIFVQVALTDGMADSIQPLIARDAPVLPVEQADTAIFYSISTAQEGLRGVTLGNFLIKLVVETLRAELPELRTFATLSPVPGFRRWLDAELQRDEPMLPADDVLALTEGLAQPGWADDPERTEAIAAPLLHAAATYLLKAKRDGRPLDPVARFHLGNGARLERLNHLGDRSAKGLEESYGLLVNYRYTPSIIEENHERYVTSGEVVASAGVRALLPAGG